MYKNKKSVLRKLFLLAGLGNYNHEIAGRIANQIDVKRIDKDITMISAMMQDRLNKKNK